MAAGLITKLVGAFGGDDDDDDATAEDAARRERERMEAEEERRAQQEALRRMREQTVEQAEESRADRMDMRGEETSSGEASRLGSLTGEPEEPESPGFSMSVGEPEVDVTVPEDEIQVTPGGPVTTSPQTGRRVNLGALQQEADALDADVPPPVDRALLPPSDTPLDNPTAPPSPQMSRVYDLALAQGSQQSMAEQGYGDPQRAALASLQQPAGSDAALAAPPPPPSGPAGAPASGPAAPSGALAQFTPSTPEESAMYGAGSPPPQGATAPPPTQSGLPGTRLPGMQQATDAQQARLPGGARPSDQGSLLPAAQPIDASEMDDDVTRQRRIERTMKVLGALLKIGGAAGGAAAIMRGNPIGALAGQGIAAGGGALTEAIGEGRGAQAERDRALGIQQQQGNRRDAMQALQAAMRQREMERRARVDDRRLAVSEGQLAAQQDQASSLREMREARIRREEENAPLLAERERAEIERMRAQVAATEQDRELNAAMRDPKSQISQNYRERIRDMAERDSRFAIPEETLKRSSAFELQGRVDAIERAIGNRHRGGGGVGGGGGSGATMSARDTPPAAFVDFAQDNYGTQDPVQIQALWDSTSERDRRQFVSGRLARDYVESEETRRRASALPGIEWGRSDPPTPDVVRDVEDRTQGLVGFNSAVSQMEGLIDQAGLGDAARSVFGLPNQLVADYEDLRAKTMNSLRKIQGMGTPSDAETARLERQVPPIEDMVRGGQARLNAMRRMGRNIYLEEVEALGFRRSEGESPGRSAPTRMRVTRPDGRSMVLGGAALARAQREHPDWTYEEAEQ